jgi:hypothetical protein
MFTLIKRGGMIAALVAVSVLAAAAPQAQAICQDPPCRNEPTPTPTPTPTPAPTTTTITKISPGFAWSGDSLTITGAGFTSASVTINGQPATITSAGSTKIVVTVPTISGAPSGPLAVPLVVTSPLGTASSSFNLSPTIETSAVQTFGVNAEFGQGMDGTAWARSTLNRFGGNTDAELTVRNTQSWLSLTVNMSTAWVNAHGFVVGYTDPRPVSSPGFMFSWPNGDTATRDYFSQQVKPDAGSASFATSARIVLVRDHDAELLSTLKNAVSTGQTIVAVVQTLAKFV